MEKRGFPHADRLIKVFAAETDPSLTLNRHITVVESEGNPFDQRFQYPGRGFWLPEELEEYFTHFHLSNEVKSKCRALFRFANSREMEIAQLAMNIRNAQTGKMQYNHPLKIIGGLEETRARDRNYGYHLDIFTPRSTEKLRHFVDLENPQTLVGEKESITLEKFTPEGTLPTKEIT